MKKILMCLCVSLAAAVPVVAQGSDDPIDPGVVVPPTTANRNFIRVVHTLNTVTIREETRHNGVLKWEAEFTVVTSGPQVTVTTTIPLSNFGLAHGDRLDVSIRVLHVEGPLTGTITDGTFTSPVDSNATSMRSVVGRREDLV